MRPLRHSALLAQQANLLDILRSFGAHYWTPSMIEAHKATELAKAPQASRLWYWRRELQALEASVIYTFFTTLVITCLALIALGLVYALAWLSFQPVSYVGGLIKAPALYTAIHVGAVWAASCLGVCAFLLTYNVKIIGPARWEVSLLAQWQERDLPPTAVLLVGEARTIRPDVDIRIHKLMQDRVPLDPILQVDGHYVLVWDKDGNIVSPPT